jgi:hypothetical protein
MDVPQQTLVDRVARCLGQRLVDCQPVAGGYSPALRLIVRCADGMSVFVKGGHRRRTATWLRTEHGV